jgi:hypothetical protein
MLSKRLKLTMIQIYGQKEQLSSLMATKKNKTHLSGQLKFYQLTVFPGSFCCVGGVSSGATLLLFNSRLVANKNQLN